jgi:cyclase
MHRRYMKGLQSMGNGSWAWLQPDGGWGWTNAGLVTDGGQSLLVDTLYDLRMTCEMLSAMRDATPAARTIDILVNSHADGDHTYGNQLVGNARIIASQATADEFFSMPPERATALIADAAFLGEGAQYVSRWMKDHQFDFTGILLTPPTETYDRKLALKVGDKDVLLTNVGPAHTAGDTIVHVVQDRVVYTADILFMNVHPAIWEGSFDGWLNACDYILSLDVDVVVPGHGPLTDRSGVRLFKTYLETLCSEARLRFEAGMTVEQAAIDIRFAPPFDTWALPERIAGSVNFLFRQWGSADATHDFMEVLSLIARQAQRNSARSGVLPILDGGHRH